MKAVLVSWNNETIDEPSVQVIEKNVRPQVVIETKKINDSSFRDESSDSLKKSQKEKNYVLVLVLFLLFCILCLLWYKMNGIEQQLNDLHSLFFDVNTGNELSIIES